MTDTDLVRLRRRYVALMFLRWFPTGLLVPVLVLLMTARGMALPTVGALFAGYGLTVLLLELPTGGVADVIGRRAVLAVAAGLTVAGVTAMSVAQSAPLLATGLIVAGVGRALDSGPLEAWYVDAAHAVDPATDLKPALSQGAAAAAVGLALGALAGGGLVTVAPMPDAGTAPLLSLSVPYLVAAALGILHLVAVLAWVREPVPVWVREPVPAVGAARLRRVVRDVPATVVGGGRLVASNRVLRRLSLRALLVGLALTTVEVLAPVQFGDSAGAGGYAALVTAGFLGTAVGARLGPAVAHLVRGTGRALVVATALAAVGLGCLALPGWWAAAGAYVAFYTALGLDDPLVGELLHAETASTQRATVLSVQSLVLQGGGLAGNLAMPALAAATAFGVAWVASAGILLVGAVLATGMPLGRRPAAEPAQSAEPPLQVAP